MFNIEIDNTVNHLFRQESGKMVAVLVKIFGFNHLELAEDVVQDALLRALETWKYKGVPDNPKAWLYRTAKNKAIDIIRKQKYNQDFDFNDPDRKLFTSEYTLTSTMERFWEVENIYDDYLGMIFSCCNQSLPPNQQITFILKIICGFSTKEIAKAFLTSEETISKRLYRTKTYFRTQKIRPSIPQENELPDRLGTVLGVIYLIFNEGYNSTHSEQPIRKDLISQALFLCKSLVDYDKTNTPSANALMSLMCLHAARIESRLTTGGQLILLDNQDRDKWDHHLIQIGNDYLNKAATGETLSMYHLEAAIAYEHCIATTYEATNWKAILEHYEAMLYINNDPVIRINKSLVVLQLFGPDEALKILAKLKDDKMMSNYYLYHAILGNVKLRMCRFEEAIEYYKKAHSLTLSDHEKIILESKIDLVEKRIKVSH